jgi:hypothetical protein
MESAPEDRSSAGAAATPSLSKPTNAAADGRKGKWTIGFVGRSKRVREAAVRDALRAGERVVATYAMEASHGRGASSGLRFGYRCVALVTPDRLVVIVANSGARITINPLVLLVSVIVHGLVPVRMPYLLFEAPLAEVNVEIRGGLSGSYVSLGVPDAEWVLRFGRQEEAAEFARLVSAEG